MANEALTIRCEAAVVVGAHSAQAIDWSPPWLQCYRRLGERAHAAWLSGATVAQALNQLQPAAGQGLPSVRFVPQSDLPAGEAYEAFIYRTACVPTRDNLHDFFNGLMWWHFPQIKRRLNQLQAQEIAARGVGQQRGPLRDALTLFDENAALLQAPAPLVAALRARDWSALFQTHRPLWATASLVLFGHALLEKLQAPRKPMTAHVLVVPAGEDLSAAVATQLTAESLVHKPFHPLPVLGVPGWWPPNEVPGFYEDRSVFRGARTATRVDGYP